MNRASGRTSVQYSRLSVIECAVQWPVHVTLHFTSSTHSTHDAPCLPHGLPRPPCSPRLAKLRTPVASLGQMRNLSALSHDAVVADAEINSRPLPAATIDLACSSSDFILSILSTFSSILASTPRSSCSLWSRTFRGTRGLP